MKLRYTPDDLRTQGVTHLGYMFGIPVYLSDPAGHEAPTVMPRTPLLDPLLSLAVFGFLLSNAICTLINPQFELPFPIQVGPRIPQLDRHE